MKVLIQVITTFYQENLFITLYLISIFIFLLMEVLFLLKSNLTIYKIKKKLERRNFKNGDILSRIIEEYKKLIKTSHGSLDTYTFIKNSLKDNKNDLFRGINFIENSSALYVLLGFLGAIFIIASSLLSTQFTGLESLSYIYSKLDNVIITIVFTLIYSLLIKIICYLFKTQENIDNLIDKIKEYLEIEIQPYNNKKYGEVQAIREYMEKIENKLSDIERTIYRGLKEIACEVNNKNYNLDRIKILHTADIHVGLKFNNLDGEKNEKLTEARYDVLERLINTANQKKCNMFVIAGDLFESTDVSDHDIFRVVDILNGFNGQVVLVLPGNHDYYSNDIKLWEIFKKNVNEKVILLSEYRPYRLNNLGLEITIYPAYCDSRDGKKNKLQWIKNQDIKDNNLLKIGIAHGAIKNKFTDITKRYFEMSEEEMIKLDIDLWLLGHSHDPYPNPGNINNQRIFNPGTPEPDCKNRRHSGNAWLITIDKDKNITARGLNTGKYKILSNNLNDE